MVEGTTKRVIASSGLRKVESINAPIKSNLKKSRMNHHHQLNSTAGILMRRVSWSDAHGKDIAHVQEFEPSEEGELEGVGKSCRCVIQ
ncbi:hypothetical protein BUALT_Bualt14G0043100 [Buddleja alternifolia]|uniref:Uncharacterized protein n=1 Tax=Buddleja alternifolia TaxID=168488 RepID=A0AAV6WG55_9LAMI|nr:hypothetical protein BUALT_Bualt14G0043100 [Buddleja alternifolia]